MKEKITWLNKLKKTCRLSKLKLLATGSFLLCSFAIAVLLVMTFLSLRPFPEGLSPQNGRIKVQIVDRNNSPLTYTYSNPWNIHDNLPLHSIPEFLQKSFVLSEDKRFFRHYGVDWLARLHALWQNIAALRQVRGASTITEQVVRMLHPRPRTLWSRWLEGFEARNLEKLYSKSDILEFYLNQVPFAAKRRGVVQAARYYFDRDLTTLSRKEILALAILVRAPSRYDLYGSSRTIEKPMARLAELLSTSSLLKEEELAALATEQLQLANANLPSEASHFAAVAYTLSHVNPGHQQIRLHSTIDGGLQAKVQKIMDQRLYELSSRHVFNGGALIVDHLENEILSWVVANAADADKPGSQIDSVLALRQPGSTLKPFLYAAAMEKGWTAATLINDSPLNLWVGNGLHTFHNYSRSHYGLVTLREALGNSLNIPAIRTIQYVGVADFLNILQQLGINSLKEHPDFYGDGLALGNGEVSLLELVQAYAVLARQGVHQPMNFLMHRGNHKKTRVFSVEVSSLIGNILSDPGARQLEFGDSSILRFPVQTAVKTGTSNDYRDAWAIGYNYRYTFGVWLGNMDGSQMEKITGSTGPALILRAIAAELNKYKDTRPLYLSPKLVRKEISLASLDHYNDRSTTRSEWFVPGTDPAKEIPSQKAPQLRFIQPSNGLHMAMDPRIPDQEEAFEFILDGQQGIDQVDWYVDEKLQARTTNSTLVWNLKRGRHSVRANVWLRNKSKPLTTENIFFLVI